MSYQKKHKKTKRERIASSYLHPHEKKRLHHKALALPLILLSITGIATSAHAFEEAAGETSSPKSPHTSHEIIHKIP